MVVLRTDTIKALITPSTGDQKSGDPAPGQADPKMVPFEGMALPPPKKNAETP